MNTPDTKHPRYAVLQSLWKLCRDFFGGTNTVRSRGQEYLLKHSAEEEESYAIRLKQAVVYNAFARAIGAITGLAFQKDPVLGDDVGVLTQQDWEDVDLQGTHGDVYARNLMVEALITGYVGVLVDHAPAQPALRLDQQRKLNIRPYWVRYTAEQIINWRLGKLGDGRQWWTLLVLSEEVEIPEGDFGTAVVPQYRVFRQEDGAAHPTWELWRPPAKNAKPQKMESGILTTSRIPFRLIALGMEATPGNWTSVTPPLYDLAELNLSHYRLWSDRRNVMHLCCVPILTEIGGTPPKPGQEERVIGPGVLVQIPNPDGSLNYVTPDGTAFEPTATELKETERRMAQVSLAFLASDTRAAETAEAKRIDSAAQNATIGSAIRALEDGLEELLAFNAEYRNEEPGSISLNRDFEGLQLTPELIKILSDMVANNQLDLDTFWDLLKQGRILPPGFKGDLVKAKLMADGALNLPTDAELNATQDPTADPTPPNADGQPNAQPLAA